MVQRRQKKIKSIGLMIVIFVIFFGGTINALEKEEPQVPPSKAIILGVPFISWAEAARLEYQNKKVVNPSDPASFGMILKYWGQDLDLLKDYEKAFPKGQGGWGIVEERKGKSIDELKPLIARGIPIFVLTALTPVAHIPNPVAVAQIEVFGLEKTKEAYERGGKLTMSKEQYNRLKSVIETESPWSGVFRKMESLDIMRQIGKFAWESLFSSDRVVIGYNDDRGVIILHDPSFGPAWEVSYKDFDDMWGAMDRSYTVAYPPDYMKVLSKRTREAAPYHQRTPDQQAAVHFVFGYALSSVGRAVEAEEEIRKGLAIPDIGKGYQHLLLFELARIYHSKGNTEEAIAMALKAIPLIPEHHRPYQFLAELYRGSAMEERKRKADDADKKAKALCSDREALQTVDKTLGRDFFIYSCRGLNLLGGPF